MATATTTAPCTCGRVHRRPRSASNCATYEAEMNAGRSRKTASKDTGRAAAVPRRKTEDDAPKTTGGSYRKARPLSPAKAEELAAALEGRKFRSFTGLMKTEEGRKIVESMYDTSAVAYFADKTREDALATLMASYGDDDDYRKGSVYTASDGSEVEFSETLGRYDGSSPKVQKALDKLTDDQKAELSGPVLSRSKLSEDYPEEYERMLPFSSEKSARLIVAQMDDNDGADDEASPMFRYAGINNPYKGSFHSESKFDDLVDAYRRADTDHKRLSTSLSVMKDALGKSLPAGEWEIPGQVGPNGQANRIMVVNKREPWRQDRFKAVMASLPPKRADAIRKNCYEDRIDSQKLKRRFPDIHAAGRPVKRGVKITY